METVTIELNGEEQLILRGSGKSYIIGSSIQREPRNKQYNGALDGIEQLVLALKCAGYSVTTPRFQNALKDALEAIGNNLL